MKKQQIPLRWPAKAGGGKVVGYLSLLYLLTYSPMKTTLHSDESSDIRWDPIELDSTQLILYDLTYQFSSVQSLSLVQLFVTPWMATFQASLSITNFWSSSKFVSIGSVMPSSHLILGHALLLLPPISPSIRVFSNTVYNHCLFSAYCMQTLQSYISYQILLDYDFIHEY